MALAILGIGLSVLIASASKCLAVIRQSKNYETARHLLALVEVEEPLLLKEKIEAGSEDGQFSGDYYNYTWTRTIEIVGDEEDGLFSVATRVSWSERGAKPFEEVVEYLYAPEDAKKGSW